MSRIWLASLVMIVWSAMAFGQATTAPSTQPQITALISRLGNDDFHTRDQAEANLVQLGTPAEPALRDAAANSKDAEIRSRAATAIQQIEQDQQAAPTLITLHVKDADPSQVMAELSRQAHVPIEVWPPQVWQANGGQQPPRVTMDIDATPFWQAMDQFCHASGTIPRADGMPNPANIILMPGQLPGHLGGIRDDHGRFTLVASMLVRNRIIALGDGSVHRDDRLQLLVFVDPRFRLINSGQPRVDVADDENGGSWIATTAAVNFAGRTAQNNWSRALFIPLKEPAHPGTKLVEFKGTIPATIASKIGTLEIPDLSKDVGVTHTIGDRTAQVRACDFANGRCELAITFTGPPQTNAPQFARFGVPVMSPGQVLFDELRSLQLFDQNGRRIGFGPGGTIHDNVVDWTCGFPAAGPPVSLKWDVATSTSAVDIPFNFKDIPLPRD